MPKYNIIKLYLKTLFQLSMLLAALVTGNEFILEKGNLQMIGVSHSPHLQGCSFVKCLQKVSIKCGQSQMHDI
jgi:hypothetical protein